MLKTLLSRVAPALASVVTAASLLLSPVTTQAAETIIYLHNDISGSPQAATDSGGNLLWKESYTPYGERTVNSPASSTGKGSNQLYFHGKKVEDLNGGVHLSYFGARYYDPSLGRFLQPDPIAFHESSIHSFNRFAYGNNNPYKFTDPDGHQATPMSNDPRLFAEQAWARFVVNANAASDAMVSFATGLIPGSAAYGCVTGGCGALGWGIASLDAIGPAGKTVGKIGGIAKEISLSRSLHGDAAQHAADAIAAGKPDVLTIARGGADANRAQSIGGLTKVPGKHLDEYPPAMFKEGGSGASVRAINPRDNMSAGACIGNACRGLPDGSKVKITVTD